MGIREVIKIETTVIPSAYYFVFRLTTKGERAALNRYFQGDFFLGTHQLLYVSGYTMQKDKRLQNSGFDLRIESFATINP